MATTATETRTAKAVVLYDGQCAFCRKSVSILRKLDWLGRLEFQNGRETDRLPATPVPLDPERLIEEMHLVTPDRRNVYAGFKAFRWMAGRLPPLWALYPALFLPGAAYFGQKVYLKIAANRFRLAPCHDGVCELPKR